MERRFQVFVSSTFRDLREERQQVIQALLELDCVPAGMELFPASDDEKWDLIKRAIDDCDYYVVIVGGRYGSTDAEGVSYTEREYDYACERDIPVLAFVRADPDEIPVGKSEMNPETRAKLDAFRAKVERRMCKPWRTPEDLGGAVSRSLVQAMKKRPREGWVRAKFATSPEDLVALRAENEALKRELEELRTSPPPGAEKLAKGDAAFELRFTASDRHSYLPMTGTLSLSWDSIFGIVGPCMFEEAPEYVMRDQFERKIIAENPDLASVQLNDEDFQTIKIQLLGLGLIRLSTKKRAVKAPQTYWTLTPYGRHRVTVLKAIRA